jgi:hypothetical protein
MRGPRQLPGLLLAFTAAVLARSASAQSFPDSATTLFRNLSGRWSCAGGFGRGGALAADLTFTAIMSAHALSFEHIDRAPSTYWQRSTWSVDARTGGIVAAGIAGSTRAYTGSPTLFVAPAWGTTRIVLNADTIKTPPFVPNRFTYAVNPAGELEMKWEVLRNGSWALGDSLVCSRD